MSLAAKTMVGMSILSDAVGHASNEEEFNKKIQLLSGILMGQYDDELLCAHFMWNEKRAPSNIEEVKVHDAANFALNRLKGIIRSDIQKIILAGVEEDKNKLLAKMKETNKPHPMGTINEIATKLGISKSEARRMKASGALDALELMSN